MGRESERTNSSAADRGDCPVRASSDVRAGAALSTKDDTPATPVSESKTGSGRIGQSSRLWTGMVSWIPFRGTGRVVQKLGQGSNEADADEAKRSSGRGQLGVGCPAQETDASQHHGAKASEVPNDISGCPVKHDAEVPSGVGTQLPALNIRNREFIYGQEKMPGQSIPLSTTRQTSTILKAEYNPSHQPQNVADKWVYPSEQQYYNAIRRKGYNPDVSDMPTTLAIHNAVNEKGWEMVKEWERLQAGTDDAPPPKLLHFEGRPRDMSPKAWIKTYLLGYQAPFDRHDWVVQRPDGSSARYVIDFYSGHIQPGAGVPVALHLDVRPAVDSAQAIVNRVRMYYGKQVTPYFSGLFQTFKTGEGSGSADASSREDAPPPSQPVTGGR